MWYNLYTIGNSLAVRWLGLDAFTAVGLGLIPGQGTKILQAARHSKKKKKFFFFTYLRVYPFKCILHCFLVYHRVVQPSPLIPDHFHHSKKKLILIISSHFRFLLHPVPGDHDLSLWICVFCAFHIVESGNIRSFVISVFNSA